MDLYFKHKLYNLNHDNIHYCLNQRVITHSKNFDQSYLKISKIREFLDIGGEFI